MCFRKRVVTLYLFNTAAADWRRALCCPADRCPPLSILSLLSGQLATMEQRCRSATSKSVDSPFNTPAKSATPNKDRRSSRVTPTNVVSSSSHATRAAIITSLPTISAGFLTCAASAILRRYWSSAASQFVAGRSFSSTSMSRSPLANNKLYETHIPTSGAEKLALSLNAALTAILDPHRGDMVAAMGETTPMIRTILEHLHQRMMRDVSGRELLRLRPRITNQTIDRDRLRMLPDGTLGREYVRFLDLLKTNPTARPPVKYIDDERLVYVMQRYRETHDFTHTLLQMRPNMLGEVTVKYFEAIQLGLPMCVSAAIFGGIRLGKNHRRQLLERNLPWVVRQAQQSRFLLALDWERRFEQSITHLQRKCSIEPLKTAGVTSPTG